jgi:DNA-binding NarL/FixJ family response regulator
MLRTSRSAKKSSEEKSTFQRRILIADPEHSFYREAIACAEGQPDLTICGEPGFLAIEASITFYRPDILMIDPLLPRIEGLRTIRSFRAAHPELKILAVSACDEELYAEAILQAGANGYLMKQDIPGDFAIAIRTLLLGKIYLSHQLSVKILKRILHKSEDGPPEIRQTF